MWCRVVSSGAVCGSGGLCGVVRCGVVWCVVRCSGVTPCAPSAVAWRTPWPDGAAPEVEEECRVCVCVCVCVSVSIVLLYYHIII